ncbi:MAG: hypothetical protein KY428_06995, partial [Bacteroidetes bacterium]|nr:hypothetical protein [Bacteroidota bacterium]
EKLLMKVNSVKHAHNDFLQIAYTFGVLGLGIWFGFLSWLWRLRKQLRLYSPEIIYLFYICFISYLIIAMASGCILRITTIPFAISVAILLYKVQEGKRLLQLEKEERYYNSPGTYGKVYQGA